MINLIFKNDQYLDRDGKFTEDIEQARIIKSVRLLTKWPLNMMPKLPVITGSQTGRIRG